MIHTENNLSLQLFIYPDVVALLLQILRQCSCHVREDEFIQKIAIYILNSLVCRVENHEKLLVGDKGAVQVTLPARGCADSTAGLMVSAAGLVDCTAELVDSTAGLSDTAQSLLDNTLAVVYCTL